MNFFTIVDCIVAGTQCWKDGEADCSANGWYYGKKNTTTSGVACVPWRATTHQHLYHYAGGVVNHNYCRHLWNSYAWCYTSSTGDWDNCFYACSSDSQCSSPEIQAKCAVPVDEGKLRCE